MNGFGLFLLILTVYCIYLYMDEKKEFILADIMIIFMLLGALGIIIMGLL